MALNGFSEVLISPNISCHFELVLVLMTIQSVVDSLHKFPIGFIEIFSHFIEIPHVVIQYHILFSYCSALILKITSTSDGSES